MRELKFRVWDSQEKVYLSEKDIAIDNLGNVFVFEGYDDNDAERWYARILSDLDNERYIIEQFTGLKDKNGRFIYENDIIKFEVSGKEYFRQVVCEHDRGCFTLIKEGDTPYSFVEMYQMSVGEFEVVGNIHQDPELLKEDK